MAFESRLEDAVDEACWAMEHVASLKQLRRREVLTSGMLMTLITALLVYVMLDDVAPLTHVLVALAGGAVTAFYASASYRARFEIAVRQRLLELGHGATEELVVHLRPEEVEIVAARGSLRVPWHEVQSVRTSNGSVILLATHHVHVVRPWAFASKEQFEQFRDLAISLAQQARESRSGQPRT